MFYAPHKLYIYKQAESYLDKEGNRVINEPTVEYLCDCFLHDISIKEQIGLSGIGIKATKKINLYRNDTLNKGDKVEIKDKENNIRGVGEIEDITHTSGMSSNYTKILI